MRVKKIFTSAIILMLSLLALVGLSLTSSIKTDYLGSSAETTIEIAHNVTVEYDITYYSDNTNTTTTKISLSSITADNIYDFCGQLLGAPTKLIINGVEVTINDYSFSYAKGASNTFTAEPPLFVGAYKLKVVNNGTLEQKIINFTVKAAGTGAMEYYYPTFDYSSAAKFDPTAGYLYNFNGISITPKITIYNQNGVQISNLANIKQEYIFSTASTEDIKTSAPIRVNTASGSYSLKLTSTSSTVICSARSEKFNVVQTKINISDPTLKIMLSCYMNNSDISNTTLFDTVEKATKTQFIGDNYRNLFFKIHGDRGSKSDVILNSPLYTVEMYSVKDETEVLKPDGVYSIGAYKAKITLNYEGQYNMTDYTFTDSNHDFETLTIPFTIGNGPYLRPQYEYRGAVLDTNTNIYKYVFDGSIHYPTISFIADDNTFRELDSSKYKISFEKKYTSNWNETESPIFTGTYRTVIENVTGESNLYRPKFYSPEYAIESKTGNAFAVKLNNVSTSPLYKYILNENSVSRDGYYKLAYVGAPLPMSFRYVDYTGEGKYEGNVGTPIIKYYRVNNFISQHEYSGISEIAGAPIQNGYYYAELTFPDLNNIVRKTDVFSIQNSTLVNKDTTLLHVEYKNVLRYMTTDTLNAQLRKGDGTLVLADNHDIVIEYRKKSELNVFTTIAPIDIGSYYFRITIDDGFTAPKGFCFFEALEQNAIVLSKVSKEYAFDITKQSLSVNVLKVSDKVYDAKTTASVGFERVDGKIFLKGIDGNDEVYIDEVNTTINFVKSINDTTPTADVKYNGNIAIARTVYVRFALGGKDKDKYSLENLFLSATISPKNVYIKGQNIELSYHQTDKTKIEYGGLFEDKDFTNRWEPISGSDVRIGGEATFQNITGVGEFEINYGTLKFDGAAKDNYKLIVPSQQRFLLTVTRTVIEIEIEPIFKEYGTEDPTIGNPARLNVISKFGTGLEVFGYKLNEIYFVRELGENAGRYALSISGVLLTKSTPNEGNVETESPLDINKPLIYANYEIKLKTASYFDIKKRELKVTLENYTEYYGIDKSVAVFNDLITIENLKGGQYPHQLNIFFTIGTTLDKFTNAGTYPVDYIHETTKILDNDKVDVTKNYSIRFISANCVIKPRPIDIIVADDLMLKKTYGELDPIISGKQLTHSNAAVEYGLLNKHVLNFEFFRDTNTPDYNDAMIYSIIPNKYKFEVKNEAGAVVTNNYLPNVITNGVKFTIEQKEVKLSLKPAIFEYSGTPADEASYEYFKNYLIYNYLTYEEGSFQYTDTLESLPSGQRPTLKLLPYAELKDGPNTVIINCPITRNYLFTAKTATMIIMKSNNISISSPPIMGDSIIGYKSYIADSKVWNTVIMYKVDTKNGNPPDQDVLVTLMIPKGVTDTSKASLYYIAKEGDTPILVEKFEVAGDGTKITFSTTKFGYYVLAQDSGKMLMLIGGIIGGGVILIVLIIIIVVVLLKLKAKKLDKLSEVAFVREDDTIKDEDDDGKGKGGGTSDEDDVSDLLKDDGEDATTEEIEEPDALMDIDKDAFIVPTTVITEISPPKMKPVEVPKADDEVIMPATYVENKGSEMIDFSGDFSQFDNNDDGLLAFSVDEQEKPKTIIDDVVSTAVIFEEKETEKTDVAPIEIVADEFSFDEMANVESVAIAEDIFDAKKTDEKVEEVSDVDAMKALLDEFDI